MIVPEPMPWLWPVDERIGCALVLTGPPRFACDTRRVGVAARLSLGLRM